MQHDTIRFDTPAKNWLSCLPIGNGHMGAMLDGNPLCEVIHLNDDTLWSGYPRDYTKQNFHKNVKKARTLLLQNQRAEAEEIVEEKLSNRFTQAYLPLGDLRIQLGDGSISDYSRSLDLSSATHIARYLHDGTQVARESFISYPADVLMHRISCDSERDFAITFECQLNCKTEYNADGLTAVGIAPSDLIIGDVGNFYSEKNRVVYDEPDRAMRFCVYMQFVCDGKLSHDQNGIHITGAKTLLITLCSATDFSKGEAYVSYAKNRVKEAISLGFSAIKEAHARDFFALYSSVSLQLGGDEADISCPERLQRMRRGEAAGIDFAILFQYGRYLLIASSRKGTQAANLQGIWNKDLIPPWWCGYTLNINLQMNYWLADRSNLSACFEPLASFTRRLSEAGRKTTRVNYGAGGSVAHHQSDLWAHSTPVGRDRERIPLSARWMMWNMALPWLSLQLFDHYQYDRESQFLLETLYPVMRVTADFLRDTFTKTEYGWCNIPSTSPENMYVDNDGAWRAVSMMSAMDIGLSKEFSLAFVQICEELSLLEEAAFWRTFSREVREYSVSEDGTLREWDADFAQAEEGHRHFSMLFGVYPGESLLTGDWMEAAKKALRQRLEHGSGQTGWSAVWAALLMARFGEGDAAYALLEKLMRENIHDNLFGAHPPELFQIDANFGFTIALCELLLQETHGVVHLLPALPKAWPEGSINGIVIHGGHVVSFGWRDGTIDWLEMISKRDDSLKLCGKGLERFGLTRTDGGLFRILLHKDDTLRLGGRTGDDFRACGDQTE